jgi:MoxR-like ATPase
MADEPTNDTPAANVDPSQPGLEGGTYEIIRKRLQDRSADLRGRLGKLNDLRKEVFGSVETVLLRADRITTEHNCIPRDMTPVGEELFLFGYNVQFGLKTTIKLSDVFAAYENTGEAFHQVGLEIIGDERFADDFQSLYKYYKNTKFVKFSFIGPYLFMVFRVGAEVSDVKTFKWSVEGDKLIYVDNRSDHEFKYPAQYEFDWKRTHRELHRSGLSPHIAIEDRVFVECINGDLTIKVEDNTETGEGVYSEPVQHPDQTLDDAEIHYALCGNLVLLKIRPFQEKKARYFIFNDKIKSVHRVDGIGHAAVLLPEDQGIIFSNGYYLQTGVLKQFESDRTDMMFERVTQSSNGEDYQYVFYNRMEGDYVLLSYNLISQQVGSPVWCHGFSQYDDGKLVYFKAQSEPQRHHTLQLWQTPFVAPGREVHENKDSFLYKIGNRDVVRCMAECQDILNLMEKDESYAGLYVDIVKLANDIADSYFWVDKAEAFNLKETLLQIKDTASKAVDEFQKVLRIRGETDKELSRVRKEGDALFHQLRVEKFETVDQFVEKLTALRRLRGESITLKELRYIDQAAVDRLEKTVAEFAETLSRQCVEFLLLSESLDPYRARVDEQSASVDGIQKVSEGRELEEQIGRSSEELELLIEIVTNLKIDDATETTRIIDGITSIFTTLNQVKVAVRKKIKSLMQVEGAAQFNAEIKLLNQSVINYLDLCDGPSRCEEYLNKVMVQFEELEGRFADFDEYIVELADKRTEVYEAFEARKLSLVEARSRKANALMSSAERILKVIRHRVDGMKSINDINGYMASDLMIEKVRSIIDDLVELDDSVKADDLQGRVKSIQQDAVRQLKDKLELFADGDNIISLGKHRFNINTQPLDLTIVTRDDEMCMHLTGTKFFDEILDEEFLSTRPVWKQEVVSENESIYRGEFLAWKMYQAATAEKRLPELRDREDADRIAEVQSFMGPRYSEAYTKGIHDHDAAAILKELVAIDLALGLAAYAPLPRTCANVFWHRFCDEETKSLWTAKLEGFGTKNRLFPGDEKHAGYIGKLEHLLRGFNERHEFFPEAVIPDAAEYLFFQLTVGGAFAISREATDLYEAFSKHLLAKHVHEQFDEARLKLADHPASEFDIIRDWLRGFAGGSEVSEDEGVSVPSPHSDAHIDEVAGLLFCENFDPRGVVSAPTRVTIAKMMGAHPMIGDAGYALDYLEFRDRLRRYETETVPQYERYLELKKKVIDDARDDLRLEEFEPRVLTSFVRNRLIDTVYLPMIGDNLAKQIGAAGDKKRTDLMGLLLLISPPGYGKTTLMEYIANRLGVVFMKINGPALGHHVTSLDPSEAKNAAAREEIEKLNLALEMGDNVMLYLDDIQHCNPELLQKFISLCDAQRKIEGVYRGRPQTYDLRGRKVMVVMAGNPYTESGDKFRIPDMLANRADTYNLGDILGGHEDAFKMSYIENCVTSNPILQQLSNKSQKDIQNFIRIAETGTKEHVDFESNYSVEEINEIVSVIKKLLHIRDAVLNVNLQYIASAAQSDEYRTEPAFKLQGSYRNMARMAEKVLPIMNDQEVHELVLDHYQNESQTLTTGAEANVLKFKELMDVQSEEDAVRWAEIKKTYKRNVLLGSTDASDPVGRVVAQLTTFSEGLDGIRTTLQSAADKPDAQPELKLDLSEMTALLDALGGDIREGLNAWKLQDRNDIQEFVKRLGGVDGGLSDLKTLIQSYMQERKAQRVGSSNVVDLSGISVSSTTLDQIYSLIDTDPKLAVAKPPSKKKK